MHSLSIVLATGLLLVGRPSAARLQDPSQEPVPAPEEVQEGQGPEEPVEGSEPAPAEAAPAPAPPDLYLRATRLIVRPGKELENAIVVVRGSKILAVGADIAVPEGALVQDAKVICAGFIDGWSSLGLDPDSVARGDSNLTTRASDALDPWATEDYLALARESGITTVASALHSNAPYRGLGTLVRTHAGSARPGAELVRDGFVALAISQSGDVFDRLGMVDRLARDLEQGREYGYDRIKYRDELLEWEAKITKAQAELEKDFKKAQKDREKEQKEAKEKGKEFKEESYKEDKQPKAPRFDAEKEVWARVVDGELPLLVEIHGYAEIRALLDQTLSFERTRLVLLGATNARPFASKLKDRRVPVVLWPAPLGEGVPVGHDLSLAGELAEEGVQVLFGSGGRGRVEDLSRMAALAVGHGLDREKALEGLTLAAARALDLGSRLGQVREGFDADLLLLDGDPLSSHTRVLATVLAGEFIQTGAAK